MRLADIELIRTVFLFALLAMPTILARTSLSNRTRNLGALWNLNEMSECKLHYTALVYDNYGCWWVINYTQGRNTGGKRARTPPPPEMPDLLKIFYTASWDVDVGVFKPLATSNYYKLGDKSAFQVWNWGCWQSYGRNRCVKIRFLT